MQQQKSTNDQIVPKQDCQIQKNVMLKVPTSKYCQGPKRAKIKKCKYQKGQVIKLLKVSHK